MLPLVAVQIGAPGLRQSHPGTTCGRLGLAAKVVGLSLSGPALAAPAQAPARGFYLYRRVAARMQAAKNAKLQSFFRVFRAAEQVQHSVFKQLELRRDTHHDCRRKYASIVANALLELLQLPYMMFVDSCKEGSDVMTQLSFLIR